MLSSNVSTNNHLDIYCLICKGFLGMFLFISKLELSIASGATAVVSLIFTGQLCEYYIVFASQDS